MGMGEIVSGGPCGRYQVRLIHNKQRIEDARAILVDRRTQMELDVARAKDLFDGAWQELQDARAELESLMQTLPAENSSVKQARNRVFFAEAAVQRAESILHQARARLTEATKRLGELALKEDPVINAVCADYSKFLTGIVGTCEVNGEGTQQVVIRPGFYDDAAYDADRDGLLFHRNSLSAEQAFFNHAIFPGWQKWLPTYRVGHLEAISYDNKFGIVYFQPMAESSSQDLRIDQAGAIAAPFEYMGCGYKAFQPGDQVLVQFEGQDWDAPKIIGFAEGPRPCLGYGEYYKFTHLHADFSHVISGSTIALKGASGNPLGSPPYYLAKFDVETGAIVDGTEELVDSSHYSGSRDRIPIGPVLGDGPVVQGFFGDVLATYDVSQGGERVYYEEVGFSLDGAGPYLLEQFYFWINGHSYRLIGAAVKQNIFGQTWPGDVILQRVSLPEDYSSCPQYSGPEAS